MKYKKLHELLKRNKEEVVLVAGVGQFRFGLEDATECNYSFQDVLYIDETICEETFGALIKRMEDYMGAEYVPNAVMLFGKCMEKYNGEHHEECKEEESSEKQLAIGMEELKKLIRIKEDMVKCIELMSKHSIKVKFEEEENERV